MQLYNAVVAMLAEVNPTFSKLHRKPHILLKNSYFFMHRVVIMNCSVPCNKENHFGFMSFENDCSDHYHNTVS